MRKETTLNIACIALGATAIVAFDYMAYHIVIALHAWRQLDWANDGFHVGMANDDMWALLTTCLAVSGTAAGLFFWQRGHSRFLMRVTAITSMLSLVTALTLRALLSLSSPGDMACSPECGLAPTSVTEADDPA